MNSSLKEKALTAVFGMVLLYAAAGKKFVKGKGCKAYHAYNRHYCYVWIKYFHFCLLLWGDQKVPLY